MPNLTRMHLVELDRTYSVVTVTFLVLNQSQRSLKKIFQKENKISEKKIIEMSQKKETLV